MLVLLVALPLCAISPGPLIVERHSSGWLELRLNRPDKLNALSVELVDALWEQTNAARERKVKGVLLTAEPGRAFCAGGDIREVSSLPLADGQAFLAKEYAVMLALHDLNREKPVVALADGFVIGAGGGLFMSAGTRIASSTTTFSMPECVLGITPDCGASDFYSAGNSMPPALGRWAALTGARLDVPIMSSTGLATHVACTTADDTAAALASLRTRVLACPDGASLAAALEPEKTAASTAAATVQDDLLPRLEAAAERVFGASGVEQLFPLLEAERSAAAAQSDTDVEAWAADAMAKMSRGCPAALVMAHSISCAKLGESPGARRAQALGMEYAANAALAGRADFQEGVACAVGSQKGAVPRWAHGSIDEALRDPQVATLVAAVAGAEPLS